MAGRRSAGVLGRLWFRTLRVEGPPPPEGPCLFLLNHPNGLLDPVVAAAVLDRPCGWLAKATLWKLAPLRPFLRAFQAIPITRPKDGGATRASILAAFRKVHEAFAQGRSVAMFPEGISHTGADLAPLKTGAARIALSSEVRPALLPAGLVYGDRTTFRHGALLRLGPPIPWDDLAHRGDEPQAVAELTRRIRSGLLPLTLHDPDARRLGLAQDIAWLLAEGPAGRADLEALRTRVRGLVALLERMEADPLADLERRVRLAQDWLRERGLRADQVGHPYAGAEVRRWLPAAGLRLAAAGLLLGPALLFWPAYRAVGLAADRLTEEGDQVATLKLLGGILVHPLWALGLSAGAWAALGRAWALAPPAALLLTLAGFPTLERAAEDLQAIRGFLARWDPEAQALAEARRELLEAFPELVGP